MPLPQVREGKVCTCDVEWLLSSLPIKMCICQCSVNLGRFVYRSAACGAVEC